MELEFSGGETIEFSPPEMLEFIKKIQRYATTPPRTYWCEFPFYIVINDFKQQYRLGYRPEDLAHIDTIKKRIWNKLQECKSDPFRYLEPLIEIRGFKLRVGDYRVIIDVENEIKILYVLKVGPRKNVYER